VKGTPTKAECELQKNLTFQTEMLEDHQQELAEELKSKKEAMRLQQKKSTEMRKARGTMKTVVLMPLTKLSLKRELIARLASTIVSSGRTLERCLN
jgi:hypothetical protein